MLDKDRVFHAYWSPKGFISVDWEKHSDGSYTFRATADVERSDEDVIAAWHKIVAEVGRGREVKGQPTLTQYDYKQGYTPMNPYAMGQSRRAKCATGEVVFIGEIVRKK